MAALRAVIFDLGHTLWDYAPREDSRRLNILRLYQRLAASLGDAVPPPAALDRALGETAQRWFDSWNSDRLEQPPSEQLMSEALVALGCVFPDDLLPALTAVMFGAEADMPVIEPDTLATIGSLQQRGLAMGCVTNTILLEEGIVDPLRRLGLLRYLRSTVVSSNMGYRKPHASLFLRALEELGVAPHEALFVGDRLVDDVGGAQGVGMRAVLTHQYRQEQLGSAAVTPDAVIQRLSELPEALERIEHQA
ncbi:MAG: HAD family hydrolase [Chloroflexi bacterium]|nr:HAD family hydrolase [Chloroflexota bacterium]